MPDPVEVLSSYAREFTVAAPTAPPATAPVFTFALTPPRSAVPDIAALIPGTETVVTTIENATVTLTWLTKDVRFVDTDITRDNTVGGMPVSDLILPVGPTPPNVALTWLTKDVRFVDTVITGDNTVGGMPVSDLILPVGLTPPNVAAATTGPTSPPGVPGVLGNVGGTIPLVLERTATTVAAATNGPTSPPGVPGLLGRFGGTIPLVVQRTQKTQLSEMPIRASVRWRIRDERGTIVPVSWSIAGVASGTDGEILQTLGPLPAMAPPSLTLTFPLLFTELSTRALPLPRRTIEVAIRLEVTAVGITTGWVDLPPLTITLPAIPIPRIAVFTENVNFGVRVLVVVPSGSPFTTISEVTTGLNTLITTLAPIASTPALSVFLTQIGLPTGLVLVALTSPGVLFQVADSMPFMRDAAWNRGWFGTNILFAANAEDSISAMALIGPPGSTMECFNAREFAPHEGQINITTGAGIMTTIRDMGSAAPPCDPPGNISIPRPPGGWYPFHHVTTFGDELSSMRFV